jgi:hypothetical protein
MKPVREIEKKRYDDQFNFLQPNPPKIYNQLLCDKLQKELGTASYEGGLYILSPQGKTVYRSKMKNPAIISEIEQYLAAVNKN